MASQVVNTGGNLIVPEIYGSLVTEKIPGHCKVAQFLKHIDVLRGSVGETVTFPVWAYIGDGKDLVPGTAMTTSQMKMTKTQAQIKQIYAPGVLVYDFDNMVAMGNAIDEAARQQATSIARKIDSDAIDLCMKSKLKVTLGTENKVTQDELLSMLALFGEDRDSADFDAFIIHSAFATSFYAMDLFVNRDKTTSVNGNGITVNGTIGTFLGIPVVLSDRVNSTDQKKAGIILLKKGALGMMAKESVFTESARDASKRATSLYCSTTYAMSILDESGVAHAEAQASEAA